MRWVRLTGIVAALALTAGCASMTNPAATASALTEAGTDVARAIADDIRLSAVALPAVADRRG